jgi:transglutaminase-like putative cysteine protease
MKPPPLMLGLGLLFWGWQTGLFWLGAGAAALVEAPQLLQARWEFSQADLDRVWNLCVALFLGATLYAFLSSDNLTAMGDWMREATASSRLATLNQSKRSLFQLLQWLPLMFLPMALAQAFAYEETMDLSTFSWWLRRRRDDPIVRARFLTTRLHMGYAFFACCLFSASTGNHRTLWFPAGLTALTVWALWLHRPRSFGPGAWTASLALALALGFGVQWGMLETQKLLQRLDEALLARWGGARMFDAKENQTWIGAIGRLKLSGRIVLRVESGDQPPPPLLREASYNVFKAPYWSSSKHEFEPITPESNQTSWVFNPVERTGGSARISGYLPNGNGLLAVPNGLARVDDLPALLLTTNRFGCIRVEDGPGFVQYDAGYQPGTSMESGPASDDRAVPSQEEPALSQIAAQLHLRGLPPHQAIQTVRRFFAEKFSYSLWQREEHRPRGNQTALARFLLEHRSGHCEYFASATVLLLRAAGIPTRYAAGFAVQEKKGRSYVVRERHAHAWCLAWVDNAWRDVDTTPPNWSAAEAIHASAWEPLRDALSWLWFEFSRWRWGHSGWKRYLVWLIIPLLGFAFGKLYLERQWNRARTKSGTGAVDPLWPGRDSEFYAIEQTLTKAGLGRAPGETASAWLERIRFAGLARLELLRPILAAHYRLRFDPAGLSEPERLRLRRDVDAWLSDNSLP